MMELDFRNQTKNPTPTPSAVRNSTPPKNLRLIATPATTPQLCSHMHWGKICLHSLVGQNVLRLKKCPPRNITQKQREPYYMTEGLRWDLYNSYTN